MWKLLYKDFKWIDTATDGVIIRNYDLCKVKILWNASCNCGTPCENSHHFFFDCDKYTDNRRILFNSLNWLPSNINIDVNLLTKRKWFPNISRKYNYFYILKTPKDLQLSKWFKEPTHISKSIYSPFSISMHIICTLYHFIAHANTYCK
jgi:hypothetical protein